MKNCQKVNIPKVNISKAEGGAVMQALQQEGCPQLPGTLIRIFIPAGAVINVLNLLELSSPSGICLLVRIPLLGGNNNGLDGLLQSIKQAGGTVEFVKG